jgi:diguanylate cyclase (GGDEF)-like protein
MKRALILLACGVAVFLSYAVVMVADAPDARVGPVTLAAIVLPGIVTGVVMLAYVSWETRNVRDARAQADELSAQLVRKEIEIGRLSTVDELTGLFTRREFDDMVSTEFERARRHSRELALLILEIDQLESVGEQVGAIRRGYLLAEIAGVLRHSLRASDVGCRFNSDSLVMILPETGGEQAMAVARKVREQVSGREFLTAIHQTAVRITVCQGIAVTLPGMATVGDLIKAGEDALREARIAGPGEIRIAPAPPGAGTDLKLAS